ncbi:peroxidase 64 [Cucumis melo var. makuwa]|uniref:Peroxidase 64 n=1 Tax=Cucumis melo var. makuwa TaxID=1194695 RepID=A0A5D3DF39_CUCMM|nr:peroxidase 64 [Cucumis melo var. makuwa]TYK22068.1 peroxidase 64 [Cucumis melo var. makuwa]
MEKDTHFGVTTGDGTRCKGKGICRRIELKLEELTIVADFLAVELGKVDVVLGMQWLDMMDTMGTMKVHWPSLTLVFWVGKKKVVLKGDPSLIRAECSLKTIEITWELEDQGFLLEWQNYEIEAEGGQEARSARRRGGATTEIQFLLTQYADIFEVPRGLPPNRV